MIDLLIAWYALGWAVCGVVYAINGSVKEPFITLSFALPPMPFLVFIMCRFGEAGGNSSQYLWRKP